MKRMRRNKTELPQRGQVVIVETPTSAYVGHAGTVVKRESTDRGSRPFTVRFNDGSTKKFRQSDLVLAL